MISNDASALKSLAVSGSPKICASGHHLLIILKAGKAAEDRCSSQKKEEGKSRREEIVWDIMLSLPPLWKQSKANKTLNIRKTLPYYSFQYNRNRVLSENRNFFPIQKQFSALAKNQAEYGCQYLKLELWATLKCLHTELFVQNTPCFFLLPIQNRTVKQGLKFNTELSGMWAHTKRKR